MPENIQITNEEANFLIALHASEEASVNELFVALLGWGVSTDVVWTKLSCFYNDGLILFFNRQGNPERLDDLTQQESVEFLIQRNVPDNWYTPCLGFTDLGWSKWEVDDWGITTKRAHFLTFTKNCENH